MDRASLFESGVSKVATRLWRGDGYGGRLVLYLDPLSNGTPQRLVQGLVPDGRWHAARTGRGGQWG